MKIDVSEPILQTKQTCNIKENNFIKSSIKPDSFEFSNTKNQNISFKGGFFSKIFKQEETPKPQIITAKTPYKKAIQDGLKEVFDKDISAEYLDFIVSPDEFKKILPTLKMSNYDICNIDCNSDNIYCADLNATTTYSKSKRPIFSVLDEAAKIADNYNKKTGKKFLFAITDLDNIGGVQQAIKIMSTEPNKYKNIAFVPSVKMSFIHSVPGQNGTRRLKCTEMMILGINPFSKEIKKVLDDTLERRNAISVSLLKEIMEKYPQLNCSRSDFAKSNAMNYDKDYNIPNLISKLEEYVLTKCGYGYVGDDEAIYKEMEKTFSKYRTKEIKTEDGQYIIDTPTGNTIDTIIDLFKKEPIKPTMAISQPFYLSNYYRDENPNTFNSVISYIKELQEKSEGMLTAFESKAPEYRLDTRLYRKPTITDFPNDDLLDYTIRDSRFIRRQEQKILQEFNDFLRNNNEIKLYEVGGSIYDPYKEKYTIWA